MSFNIKDLTAEDWGYIHGIGIPMEDRPDLVEIFEDKVLITNKGYVFFEQVCIVLGLVVDLYEITASKEYFAFEMLVRQTVVDAAEKRLTKDYEEGKIPLNRRGIVKEILNKKLEKLDETLDFFENIPKANNVIKVKFN